MSSISATGSLLTWSLAGDETFANHPYQSYHILSSTKRVIGNVVPQESYPHKQSWQQDSLPAQKTALCCKKKWFKKSKKPGFQHVPSMHSGTNWHTSNGGSPFQPAGWRGLPTSGTVWCQELQKTPRHTWKHNAAMPHKLQAMPPQNFWREAAAGGVPAFMFPLLKQATLYQMQWECLPSHRRCRPWCRFRTSCLHLHVHFLTSLVSKTWFVDVCYRFDLY